MMKNLFKSMINFFLITLIILNADLNAYAETKSNILETTTYQLSLEEKNIFLNNTIDNKYLISIANNESSSKNNNLWMLSFIYPGLGQMFMGEIGLGSLFAILPIIIIGFSTYFFIDFYRAINSGAVSFIPAEILIGLPALLLLSINYISSLINSYSIAQKLSNENKEKNYLEKELPYLWMSSIIVPGSGQIFSGELLKGLGFFILELSIYFAGFIISQIFSSVSPIIAYTPFVLFHIWNIYDSYNEFNNGSDIIENKLEIDPSLFVKNHSSNYDYELKEDLGINLNHKPLNVNFLIYKSSF